jgi:hypothetical protein
MVLQLPLIILLLLAAAAELALDQHGPMAVVAVPEDY